jgi:hypothetical protein
MNADTRRLVGSVALWAALHVSVVAAEFTFGAFGDTPYTWFEEVHFPALVAELNKEDLAFVVHVGDFKSGRVRCSDELFLQRRQWFETIRHPFIFVPGDNEWTDCRNPRAGGYDPLERLEKLRELFFRSEYSLGQRRIRLERQSAAYPEHARWRHERVLFVSLNVPGHDNNALLMPEEFRTRSAAVDQWLEQSFSLARTNRLHGVVVLMQANPWLSPAGFFRELLGRLATESRSFDGEVLLVHGDTHRPRVDQPLRDPATGAPIFNFTRVEVFGSLEINWMRIRVRDEAGRVVFEATQGSWYW